MKHKMKKRETKKFANRRTSLVETKYRQGDTTIKVGISAEKIRCGTRYRIHASILPPDDDGPYPILPQPVFWSWAFGEKDLDCLVYHLAIALGYDASEELGGKTTWVAWSDKGRVSIAWVLGSSGGRVMVPRRAASRIFHVLAAAADWEIWD